VPLVVAEPAGVDRIAAPVTRHTVCAGCAGLGRPVRLLECREIEQPLQTSVLARWPDQGIKWLLLDLQATVAARQPQDVSRSNSARP